MSSLFDVASDDRKRNGIAPDLEPFSICGPHSELPNESPSRRSFFKITVGRSSSRISNRGRNGVRRATSNLRAERPQPGRRAAGIDGRQPAVLDWQIDFLRARP